MEVKNKEKRTFLRIPVDFPIKISNNGTAQGIDISETGLGFFVKDPLSLSKAKIQMDLSSYRKIEADFNIIWSEHIKDGDKFRYGVTFDNLKGKDIKSLLFVLIQKYVAPFLDTIHDKKMKEVAQQFWYEHFLEYLYSLSQIDSSMRKNILTKEIAYNKTEHINNDILKKGDTLETILNDKRMVKKLKEIFRELSSGRVYQAPIVRHAFNKPHGYPGDHELIEIIYKNDIPFTPNIGYCYDRYLLENEYAVAVRNRKECMKSLIVEFINKCASSFIEILNLGCGSSREIKEIFIDDNYYTEKSILFTLVDQDIEALDFSQKMVSNTPQNIQYSFFDHNVIDYAMNPDKYYQMLGKKDLVYSIGLSDYLPERVLKRLIYFSFNLLKNNGKIIIAHKDSKAYKPLAPDWWCDWRFYHRSEEEVIDIFKNSGIKDYEINITHEPSDIIFFVIIKRK